MDNIYEIQEKNKTLYNNEFYLKDSDFYPPSDDRTLDIHRRIYKGKDFEEYASYIYDLYEYEEFYEN